MEISQFQQKILYIFLQNTDLSSSHTLEKLIASGEGVSLVTVKRALSALAKLGLLETSGSGRSTVYAITTPGKLVTQINAKEYVNAEPDLRGGQKKYNFDLFPKVPNGLFHADELKILREATLEYNQRTKNLSVTLAKKELQRLIIELSWKSSKIEGNTYTLLDTEKLLLEHKEAKGHSTQEAQMILNHKDAFAFIHRHKSSFKTLTKRNLEQVHALLIKNLDINKSLRSGPVGVTGSSYRPLENVYQISEAVEALSLAVGKQKDPYGKALLGLLGISYIQPFEDGNKRTARLMANALLLAHNCAPLSYRSVDEEEYRDATLVFYELNSLAPFKKIFISQYDFAARNYAVK